MRCPAAACQLPLLRFLCSQPSPGCSASQPVWGCRAATITGWPAALLKASCQQPQHEIMTGFPCALQEMPAIRFRAAKPPDMDADDSPVLEARALVSQRLAIELDAQLQGMQSSGLLPPGGPCSAQEMRLRNSLPGSNAPEGLRLLSCQLMVRWQHVSDEGDCRR